MSKMSFRNCEIFASVQAGKSPEEVAGLHGLTRARVLAILREEELKRRYSLEEAYRDLCRQAR